jgi:hypothetical protein
MSIFTSLTDAATVKASSLFKTKSSPTNLDKFSTGGNKYAVQNLMYPSNLTVDADMQHWVTFYINVRGASKIAQDKSQLATGQPVSIKGENRLDPTQMDNATTAAGAIGGAVVGLSIGKKLGTFAGKAIFAKSKANGSSTLVAGTAGLTTMAAGAIAGAGVGAAVGGTASYLTVKSDTTYRLKDAITLHVSQAPSAHYGADYDIVELGAIGGFAAGGSSYSDTIKASDRSMEGLLGAAREALKGPAGLITSGNGKALIEAASKKTLNPYREVLFKSIGFRKFAFDYRFFPQSQAETDQIQKIIYTFKYHMHPEMSAGGLFYIHPSEFNIQYYFKGAENKYFNKISTCVLTDMHVDYGGQEDFSSFKDGAPVEISMRLQFQELETMTKERIADGY